MLASFITALVLAALPSAQIVAEQPISFTGVVQAVDFGPGIICAPPTHEIECAGGTFFLTSTTINLNFYIGKNVKLTGTNIGAGCPTWDVSAVEDPPPTSLIFCGSPTPSCPIRLRSVPGGISQHFLLLGFSPGLTPKNLYSGSLLLGDPWFVLASTSGAVGLEGAAFDFQLPGDAALAGLSVWFQAVRRDVGPVGPFRFSNAVCITLTGPSPPCIDPLGC
jgi:hypothetical protein